MINFAAEGRDTRPYLSGGLDHSGTIGQLPNKCILEIVKIKLFIFCLYNKLAVHSAKPSHQKIVGI